MKRLEILNMIVSVFEMFLLRCRLQLVSQLLIDYGHREMNVSLSCLPSRTCGI